MISKDPLQGLVEFDSKLWKQLEFPIKAYTAWYKLSLE